MNDSILLHVFDHIDDRWIMESERIRPQRIRLLRKTLLLAATVALITAIAVFGIVMLLRGGDGVPSDGSSTLPPVSSTPNGSPFTVNENGILLTYTGNESEVFIPEGVVTLSQNAFVNASNVRVIYLSSTVRYIEDGCLEGCATLESVKHGENGNEYIQEGVYVSFDGSRICFVNKDLIGKVIVPEGVTVIEAKKFQDREFITELVFPSTLTEIGRQAFSGCVMLRSVEFNGNALLIGPMAFEDCVALKEITLRGVREVGENAFYNCEALQTVDCGDARIIGAHAFNRCTRIDTIYLRHVEYVKEEAFFGIGFLKHLDMGDSLLVIERNAFFGRTIRTIQLPETVQRIENGALDHMGLQEVIFEGAPYQWEKVHWVIDPNITVRFLKADPEENPLQYHSNGDGTCTVSSSSTKLDEGELVIPATAPNGDTVTEIGDFKDCMKLTSVVIPKTVTVIKDEAFLNCNYLTTVRVEEGSALIEIGERVFSGCRRLESVSLPSSLRLIKANAFKLCTELRNVEFAENMW